MRASTVVGSAQRVENRGEGFEREVVVNERGECPLSRGLWVKKKKTVGLCVNVGYESRQRFQTEGEERLCYVRKRLLDRKSATWGKQAAKFRRREDGEREVKPARVSRQQLEALCSALFCCASGANGRQHGLRWRVVLQGTGPGGLNRKTKAGVSGVA